MRIFLALVVCAVMGACGEEDPAASAVFLGELQGGDVLAASIWMNDNMLLYTCGADGTLDDSTAWLTGSHADGSFEIEDAPFSAVGTREGESVMGTFSNAAGMEDLNLAAADNPTRTGLFVNIDGPCRTGAIVLDRGGSRVLQGAHFCDDGRFFQVTPVRLPAELESSISVNFDDGSGVRELELDRFVGF